MSLGSAEIVPDPDAVLVASWYVAVLDLRLEWVSLGRVLVEAGIPGAFVVDRW
ncbi:MAG: hypothetical protein AB7K24_31900 [Gemmataceae bacterium]